MRVKIGDTWYSAAQQAICVELSSQDRENIANMDPGCDMYAVFPDDTGMTKGEMLEWMGRKEGSDE